MAISSIKLKVWSYPSYIYYGIKADIWDGGHQIPFVARWPAMIPAGTISQEPIFLTDLIGTVAKILGFDLPGNAGEDSHNMLLALY